MRKNILIVLGTRPEVIKLAPVYHALKRRGDLFEVRIAATAQHRHMLDQAMEIFGATADFDLDIMTDDQDLFDVTAASLMGLRGVLDAWRPDCVLVQGDTSTTFSGALAAFYRRIPVGHVEAGLRTYDLSSPFPEEANRCLTSTLADFHWAPTERARAHLLHEHVDDTKVWVTGNTSIDAVQWVLANTKEDLNGLPDAVQQARSGRFVLVTSHRRESFGAPMANAFRAMVDVVERFDDVSLVFPVHRNPNVRREVESVLRGVDRVHLLDPLDYVTFAHLMAASEVILTDSGGIQEEAPALGKPVLVMRDTTERPEGIEAGTAKLVGTDRVLIVDEVSRLLTDRSYYDGMANRENPYGDGRAAERIADCLVEHVADGRPTT